MAEAGISPLSADGVTTMVNGIIGKKVGMTRRSSTTPTGPCDAGDGDLKAGNAAGRRCQRGRPSPPTAMTAVQLGLRRGQGRRTPDQQADEAATLRRPSVAADEEYCVEFRINGQGRRPRGQRRRARCSVDFSGNEPRCHRRHRDDQGRRIRRVRSSATELRRRAKRDPRRVDVSHRAHGFDR